MEDLAVQFQRDVPQVLSVQRPSKVKAGGDTKTSVRDRKNTEEKAASSRGQIDVAELVEKVTQQVQAFSTKIAFSYDAERRQASILVTERETGKIIRQIPPQEMLTLMEKMDEITGIIYNRRA